MKRVSAQLLMYAVLVAIVLTAVLASLSLTGCVARVDRTLDEYRLSSNICSQAPPPDGVVAQASTVSSRCQAKFPERTIYRDKAFQLLSARSVQPWDSPWNGSQVDGFSPFWVLF